MPTDVYKTEMYEDDSVTRMGTCYDRPQSSTGLFRRKALILDSSALGMSWTHSRKAAPTYRVPSKDVLKIA